ncbi:MAG: AEC family transporter [Oscillospiraceae bacterium]|nr:AEC family transporter [Oscillospiraceae bacterium]
MLQDVGLVAGNVLMLFLLMAVGFVLVRLGWLGEKSLSEMSRLLLYVVTPAIMIDTFQSREPTPETLHELWITGAVLVGIYLILMLLIAPWYRKQTDRGVLRFGSIYGNAGFMGVPLIQAVLGEAGMLTTVIHLAIFNMVTWTHGVWLMGGREQISLKKMVLNPGVLGFAIALGLFLLRIRLPGPVGKTVSYLASLNTPLAMIVIGGQMASVDLKSLFGDWRLFTVSATKLLIMPAIALLLLMPLDLPDMTVRATVILMGCPVAGVTSLFCQSYGEDKTLGARLVTVSTALCILTLPLAALAAKAFA